MEREKTQKVKEVERTAVYRDIPLFRSLQMPQLPYDY